VTDSIDLRPGKSFAPPEERYPFIDGLRAVAILAVVLFHAGVPGTTGGFVGVDVFFVISGFLIIGIISRGIRSGTFSLWSFYARRSLRILPPFLIVLVASAVLAYFLLISEKEILAFAESFRWTALMGANIHLYLQQNYFDAAAETKPLLNMWSLAVEEQFYLLAPLLLVGVAMVRVRLVRTLILSALALASFVACILLTTEEANLAFYMAPLRGWQFAAGGAVYLLVPLLARRRLVAELAGIAGLLAIAAAVILYSAELPYPSHYAALPTLGSAAVIGAGVARGESIVARVLSTPALRGIGLVSYSWYLWHWPLLTFWRLASGGQSTLAADLLVLAIAFALAVATYLLVERPIHLRRHRWSTGPWKAASTLAGLALAGFLSLASAAGAPSIAADAARWTDADINPPPQHRWDYEKRDHCFVRADASFDSEDCLPLLGDKRPLLLAGDSHVAMLYPYFFGLTETGGSDLRAITQYSNSCRPYLAGGPSRRCNTYFETTNKALEASEIDFQMAVLNGAWNRDIHGTSWFATAAPEVVARRAGNVAKALRASIDYLLGRGVERILLVGPVPELAADIPDCLMRAKRLGLSWDLCSVPRSVVDARRMQAVKILESVAQEYPQVRYIDPIASFCDDTLCRPYRDGKSLYNDSHHISPTGVRMLFDAFAGERDWLLSQ
jgi:peptidoglycan/LPS O-acetylase OafA/YrhL